MESPMPSHPPARPAAATRDRFWWSVMVLLAMGQLVAFWMLCAQQVRKAQMRDVSLEVQRVAVADCLRYVPRATLSSCADRVDPARGDPAALAAARSAAQAAAIDAVTAPMSNPAPVSISYR
jgi:hypothetical protein